MTAIDAAIIKHITSGSGGGGSSNGIPEEDELEYNQDQDLEFTFSEQASDGTGLTVSKMNMLSREDIMTGNIIKFYNPSTDQLDSFMLIRSKSEKENNSTSSNAYLINMITREVLNANVSSYYESGWPTGYTLQVSTIGNQPDIYHLEKDKGCGVYRMIKMSYQSLMILLSSINAPNF